MRHTLSYIVKCVSRKQFDNTVLRVRTEFPIFLPTSTDLGIYTKEIIRMQKKR